MALDPLVAARHVALQFEDQVPRAERRRGDRLPEIRFESIESPVDRPAPQGQPGHVRGHARDQQERLETEDQLLGNRVDRARMDAAAAEDFVEGRADRRADHLQVPVEHPVDEARAEDRREIPVDPAVEEFEDPVAGVVRDPQGAEHDAHARFEERPPHGADRVGHRFGEVDARPDVNVRVVTG
jgi:hypothetical protein